MSCSSIVVLDQSGGLSVIQHLLDVDPESGLAAGVWAAALPLWVGLPSGFAVVMVAVATGDTATGREKGVLGTLQDDLRLDAAIGT